MKSTLLRLLAISILLTSPAEASYKIVAYFFGEGAEQRQYAVSDIPADKLTHLIYAFAGIEDGVAAWGRTGMDSATAQRLEQLQALRQRYPHLRTLLSIGGWTGSAHFSDVSLSETSRARFAASAVTLMREGGFDGLDIDWEFPVAGGNAGNVERPVDKQNYTLLLRSLRQALDREGQRQRRHLLLTGATGASQRWLDNTEMAAAAAELDWVNLMSYDFNGPWNAYAGHLAPLRHDPANRRADASLLLNVEGALKLYRQAGVPAGKIVLGLPFYGYWWKACQGDGLYQDCQAKGDGDGALDYSRIEEQFIGKQGFVRRWSQAAQVPYLFKAEGSEFISYEDPQSVKAKLQLLRRLGLGGAMFWELSNDRRQTLLRVVHDGLRRK
ncbi:glycoside hydrolase family 18 protein [Chitinimonas sp.]|uniref:glycoside hydrolase family 18 protein n=1 Tax=Chitinimonas sp. TaxID=1934313 RepID=UPI0035B15097